MTAPSESPADAGVRLAAEYVQLLRADRTADAEQLLAGLSDLRELAFVGSALTTTGRRTGRTLPTAMRAQSSSRQVLLGQLRDRNRGDVEGLRSWVRKAAEEVVLVEQYAEAARRRLGDQSQVS